MFKELKWLSWDWSNFLQLFQYLPSLAILNWIFYSTLKFSLKIFYLLFLYNKIFFLFIRHPLDSHVLIQYIVEFFLEQGKIFLKKEKKSLKGIFPLNFSQCPHDLTLITTPFDFLSLNFYQRSPRKKMKIEILFLGYSQENC
jgi:hypothetical protein